MAASKNYPDVELIQKHVTLAISILGDGKFH